MKEFDQIKYEEELIKKIKNSSMTKSPSRSISMLWNHHQKKLFKFGYSRETVIGIFENCEDMATLENNSK